MFGPVKLACVSAALAAALVVATDRPSAPGRNALPSPYGMRLEVERPGADEPAGPVRIASSGSPVAR